MAIAFPGSANWYNSAERSEKLRKERKAHEVTMKGTFEDQTAAAEELVTLKGEQNKLLQMQQDTAAGRRQTGINIATGERATAGNVAALEKQRIANRPGLARVEMETPVSTALTSLRTQQAEGERIENVGDQFTLDEMLKGRKPMNLGGLTTPNVDTPVEETPVLRRRKKPVSINDAWESTWN